MSGFGEAAAAISLAIQVFDGCIKGFVILSAAQNLGSRADVLLCQLEWEHYCLSWWANVVGLFKTPPELNVTYAPLVHKTLATLEQLLNNTEQLKRNYGLDIKITEEEVLQVSQNRKRFGILIDNTKPEFVNDTAKVFSRRNGAWRKFKWGAFDADKLRLLLKDIHYFNEQLKVVLYPTDQQANLKDHDEVMRSVLAKGPDKGTLDAMSGPLTLVDDTIAASARLRHKGLLLDLIPLLPGTPQSTSYEPSQTSTAHKYSHVRSSKEMRKSPNQLLNSQGHSSGRVIREVALFDGKRVVVEWKDVADHLESKLKHRIANIAAFLVEMRDPSFHSLQCIGYLKASSGRYAYLFEPPTALGTDFKLFSLRELLSVSSLRPNLEQRIAIGVALAQTVLQLHTAGLLHKGIRPENVLFFKPGSAELTEIHEPGEAYLGGYDFARADNPLESTEDHSSHKTTELYRHPESLGLGRVSYNKSFDLYSLGCVLIELAFWEPLPLILWQKLNGNQAISGISGGQNAGVQSDAVRERLLLEHRHSLLSKATSDSIAADLRFRMGSAYEKVVAECLQITNSKCPSVDETFDDSVIIQERVVTTLRTMQCAL